MVLRKMKSMILAIIGVIIGFVLLVKGADFFVEGSKLVLIGRQFR